MSAAAGTTIEAGGLTREHEGSSLMLTFSGTTNADAMTWTVGGVEIAAVNLIMGGGSLANYNASTRQAEVTVPARMSNGDVTFTIGGNPVLPRARVNEALVRGVVVEPGASGTHVMLRPGVFVCRAHPEEHFFLLGHRANGREGGVARLDFTRGHGQTGTHQTFASYPTCDPFEGAQDWVLFGDAPHRNEIAVACAATHFRGTPRVAAPPR